MHAVPADAATAHCAANAAARPAVAALPTLWAAAACRAAVAALWAAARPASSKPPVYMRARLV